ncbi:MAG TPA: hypothetical protein PKY59_16245 [Pyrinomonadaceae bacterium]|nr:hypothetical protein [Pyrinomonadaceae bacterium]
MIELEPAIQALYRNEVEFVVVGGVAITAYGSAYVTQDLDFCYSRSLPNLKKIANALASFNPRLRGFPKELPFIWDERTLQNGTNFTLDTDLGDIDLLGEVSGVGDYSVLIKSAQKLKICGIFVDVISMDDLISAKRAAGRTKDLLVLPELEALRELLNEEED